ncbi:MAG: hypothetical protein IKX79_01640, partial [Desulfovibrionaceae bacterium]|nr:hypothetical protein [Desulfovibrionaceae bacterium]
MNLSKSRYTLFCQCPKALWLKVHKPETAVLDPGVQTRFAAGTEVGRLAQDLFGPSVDVTVRRADGGLDLAAMLARTKECLSSGVEVICEASFAADGFFCSADILRREKGGFGLYEVKSSKYSPSSPPKKQEEKRNSYAQDIACQKWLLERCG